MRNLLALAALGLIVFFGVGWFLGWYKVQTTPTADGHRQIAIDLNTDKIKNDVTTEENKLHDLLAGKDGQTPPTTNTNTPTKGTAASFSPADDGSFIFPAANTTPPSGGPALPPPR
jgi:hypothetical protein